MADEISAAEFESLAEDILEHLFDALDGAIGDDADVDLEGSILTIEFEDGRQYVINRHGATREIWMSSPVSGAAHYRYDREAGAWVSTRDASALVQTLAAELAGITGTDVDLN